MSRYLRWPMGGNKSPPLWVPGGCHHLVPKAVGNSFPAISVVFLFWFCYILLFRKSFNFLKIKYGLKNSPKKCKCYILYM
jgi:hypothetical protein